MIKFNFPVEFSNNDKFRMKFCLFTDFHIIFLFIHLIIKKKTYLCFYDNKQKRFNDTDKIIWVSSSYYFRNFT